jgi:type I restriction enzyme S subunit
MSDDDIPAEQTDDSPMTDAAETTVDGGAVATEAAESRFWGVVPPGWELVEGSEVYDVNPSYTPEEEEVTYIEMDALDTELPFPKYSKKRKAADYSGKLFREGDTLFARITPCTENGKTAFVDEMDTDVGIGSTEYAVLSPDRERIHPMYLYYLAKSYPVRNYAISRMRGSTGRQRVPFEVFRRELDIVLPPYDVQSEIASILYNTDLAIRNSNEVISKTKRIRKGFTQKIFEEGLKEPISSDYSPWDERKEEVLEKREQKWWEAEKERRERTSKKADRSGYDGPLDLLSQRLPDLPEGWRWVSLDTLVAYDIDYRGKTPPYSDSGIPVLSSGNIQNGEIDLEDTKYVSEETYEEWLTRGVPKEGDFIVTTEAPVGKVAIFPEGDYLPTRRIITLRTVGVDNRYLKSAFDHPRVQNYLKAQSGGSTVSRILKDYLLRTPIPLPPAEEESQIVDALSTLDRQIEKEQEMRTKFKTLKKGIMQDLLTGDVRISDENIEIIEKVREYV